MVPAFVLAAVCAPSVGGAAGAARPAFTLTPTGAKQQYVPGQVVVRFRANAGPLGRREALSDGRRRRSGRSGSPGCSWCASGARCRKR